MKALHLSSAKYSCESINPINEWKLCDNVSECTKSKSEFQMEPIFVKIHRKSVKSCKNFQYPIEIQKNNSNLKIQVLGQLSRLSGFFLAKTD